MATAHMQLADLPVKGIAGPFAEKLLRSLAQTLEFEGFKVQPKWIELGENMFDQTVALDFSVFEASAEESTAGTNVRESTISAGQLFTPAEGPVFTYSFLPGLSIAENLNDFKEFVKQHTAIAATPPAARYGATAARKQPPSNH